MTFDWIVGTGATALGIVVGSMVGMAVMDQRSLTVKALRSIVSALVGGGVLGLFHLLAPGSSTFSELWLYPVGLLIGISVTIVALGVAYARKTTWASQAAALQAYLEGRSCEAVGLREAGLDLLIEYVDLRVIIEKYSQLFYIVKMADGTLGVALRRRGR